MAESEKIKKNDFIEIEFTGRVKEGEVFDTTDKEEAKKANLDVNPDSIKPVILSVGHSMVIKGLDSCLEGKEMGKKYSEEISPDNAFGNRDPKLVRMIPIKLFLEQKVMPERGMQFALDGNLVRVISVSGGRVLVDFNNPLAGKNLVYDFTIKRIVTDLNEKVNAVQDFFFRKRFDFSLSEDKKTITFKIPEAISNIMKLFEKQFKEILQTDISAEIIQEAKQEESKSPAA